MKKWKELKNSDEYTQGYRDGHNDTLDACILPERLPKAGDKQGELLCAGFNDYRNELLEKLVAPSK